LGVLSEDWVWVEPGRFTMGRPPHPNYESDSDLPHTVTLTRGFWVQRFPVTQAAWKTRMKNNPSKHARAADAAQRPVENVSWLDAVAYCNALSRKHKRQPAYTLHGAQGKPGSKKTPLTASSVTWDREADGFRLLTEAEWEYACRAGTQTITHAEGSSADDYKDTDAVLAPVAWYAGNAGTQTHPIGTRQPNPWGLHDMLGNVTEWVWDWSASYDTADATDPTGPEEGSCRVIRGGSWGDYPSSVTSCARNNASPGSPFPYAYGTAGFRCACFAPDRR